MIATLINLQAGWTGMFLGMLSGLVLGLFFHRDDWLGGYGSFRRRLYRLAHISLFGLGATNILFHLTMVSLGSMTPRMGMASWALVVGAIAMPLCCVLMAHVPKARMVFAVPVFALIVGVLLTLIQILLP